MPEACVSASGWLPLVAVARLARENKATPDPQPPTATMSGDVRQQIHEILRRWAIHTGAGDSDEWTLDDVVDALTGILTAAVAKGKREAEDEAVLNARHWDQ